MTEIAQALPATTIAEENRIFVANQWQLMWWRFRKHRLAMISAVVVILFYLVALFAPFLAYANPEKTEAFRALIAPQAIHWFDGGAFRPHVYALESKRDPVTFKRVYEPNPDEKIPLKLFARGFKYSFLGLFETDIHLIGIDTEGYSAEENVFLLGTDELGRDLWSRLMYASRISLTIGLAGVLLSLLLGMCFGGISGYFGGVIDTAIQRVIEVLRSIPTIPLWLGLAAALPHDWSIVKIYFAITIIISLLNWTELARVVRGRFLSLREDDFVLAAELIGCSRARIIFRHMMPSFISHIIAATTLAIPSMIIAETSLSFLGLGLRPPAISWGVLLQNSQNIQAITLTPWLLIPAIPVVVVIIAFNFLGDGLRDAADPYSV